jgi:hypothetical protein
MVARGMVVRIAVAPRTPSLRRLRSLQVDRSTYRRAGENWNLTPYSSRCWKKLWLTSQSLTLMRTQPALGLQVSLVGTKRWCPMAARGRVDVSPASMLHLNAHEVWWMMVAD